MRPWLGRFGLSHRAGQSLCRHAYTHHRHKRNTQAPLSLLERVGVRAEKVQFEAVTSIANLAQGRFQTYYNGVPMSLSPDTPKGANFPVRAAIRILWAQSPVLILLRGLVWVALILAAVTTLVMNFEIIWEFLAEAVPLALEVVEQALDTFFESVVKLSPVFSQMATAYTGFVVFLVLLYFVSRKAIKVYAIAKVKKNQIIEVYANAWAQLCGSVKTSFQTWWDSLDSFNKVIAMISFVLLGIPLALLISYVLGSLVATLL